MEHDILAFGQDLIAARPRLHEAARTFSDRPAEAGRLVTRTMDDAWRSRGQFRPDQDLDSWLQGLLRRAAGERRTFAED
jgi:DNA-directed RNA polymerase specialized sigma24 family protein